MGFPIPAALRRLARDFVNAMPVQSQVQARVREIEERYEIRYRQLADVVQQMGGLIPPPMHLQHRVVGTFSPQFISSGETIVSNLRDMLQRVGRELSSFANILDFGCGCGRVTRTLHYHTDPQQRLYGTDIDPEAIEWCRANYGAIATFDCNPHMPPTRYADGTFDLVYSGSVFTHLPEDMQWAWLRELNRITRPGAYLALTFHGVHYHGRLEGEMKAELEGKGFVYGKFGRTPGLPEFYETTWHSHEYVRSRWSEVFDIVHIEPRGLEGMQDIALCRRR
jgi:SAM-dependent methyltransferase